MDKKQLLLKIKANPTQYVEILLEGYNPGVLDFDQHFDLLMMCNKKWSVQKPVDQLLAEIQTKKLGIKISSPTEDEISRFITEVK